MLYSPYYSTERGQLQIGDIGPVAGRDRGMVGWRRQKDKEGLNMGKQVNLRQALRQARPATVSIRLRRAREALKKRLEGGPNEDL